MLPPNWRPLTVSSAGASRPFRTVTLPAEPEALSQPEFCRPSSQVALGPVLGPVDLTCPPRKASSSDCSLLAAAPDGILCYLGSY